MLISLAQSSPENFFGQQIAQLIRKVMGYKKGYIDTHVEGYSFRGQIAGNNSERKYLFMPWRFDKKEKEYIYANLPIDGVFIDIGANVGIYSLWALSTMGDNGIIVSFEPNSEAFCRLEFNLLTNLKMAGKNIQIFLKNKCISDRESQLELHIDPKNLGGASLVLHKHEKNKITVDCCCLLDALNELNIKKMDLLKLTLKVPKILPCCPFSAKLTNRCIHRV